MKIDNPCPRASFTHYAAQAREAAKLMEEMIEAEVQKWEARGYAVVRHMDEVIVENDHDTH